MRRAASPFTPAATATHALAWPSANAAARGGPEASFHASPADSSVDMAIPILAGDPDPPLYDVRSRMSPSARRGAAPSQATRSDTGTAAAAHIKAPGIGEAHASHQDLGATLEMSNQKHALEQVSETPRPVRPGQSDEDQTAHSAQSEEAQPVLAGESLDDMSPIFRRQKALSSEDPQQANNLLPGTNSTVHKNSAADVVLPGNNLQAADLQSRQPSQHESEAADESTGEMQKSEARGQLDAMMQLDAEEFSTGMQQGQEAAAGAVGTHLSDAADVQKDQHEVENAPIQLGSLVTGMQQVAAADADQELAPLLKEAEVIVPAATRDASPHAGQDDAAALREPRLQTVNADRHASASHISPADDGDLDHDMPDAELDTAAIAPSSPASPASSPVSGLGKVAETERQRLLESPLPSPEQPEMLMPARPQLHQPASEGTRPDDVSHPAPGHADASTEAADQKVLVQAGAVQHDQPLSSDDAQERIVAATELQSEHETPEVSESMHGDGDTAKLVPHEVQTALLQVPLAQKSLQDMHHVDKLHVHTKNLQPAAEAEEAAQKSVRESVQHINEQMGRLVQEIAELTQAQADDDLQLKVEALLSRNIQHDVE